MATSSFSIVKPRSLTTAVVLVGLAAIADAQIPPPQITTMSPDRGWPGGTRSDGTVVDGTQVVIEGTNFHADPAQNQVTFTGPGETRIPAPVIWASPSALHYSPAGILDDSANFNDPFGMYIPGFHRAEGIAVWRESVGDRFYATFPTLQTSAASTGTLGTVKYPLGGFNYWTMLNFSSHDPYRFNRPTGIAVDDEGRVYLTNRLLHRVETYTGNLGKNSDQTTWGTEGSGSNQFDGPRGIDVVRLDGTNFVFVADTGNGRIVRTRDDGTNFTVLGAPTGTGPIESLAAHRSGMVYATDREHGRLVRYDGRTGSFLGFFGAADLTHPVGVDVDADGFVYVIDGRWVKKLDPSGDFLSKFGYTDSGDPLEVLPEEALQHPQDLAITGDGNVLVVDSTLLTGHVSRWAPSDAQELWVRVPEGAVTGDVEVQTPTGTDSFYFLVLEPGPISVTGWSVNQGIDEYPMVADKKTAVVVELSTPPNPDPSSFEINTFGSPVTDAVELIVDREGVEVFRTSGFEVDGIDASSFIAVNFLLVAEVPQSVVAAPGQYTFALAVSREGELDFTDTSTRQVTRRRSPKIGAVVLSHLRYDGSLGLGDPLLELIFPIPTFEPEYVSWFDLTEMYRGFLNFNRYYPVPTRLTDVEYLGAMPIPGIADGVTNANASDLLDWLEGVRLTLNEDGDYFEALIGLFDRQFVAPGDGQPRWRGKAVYDDSERTGLVTIGKDEIDPTETRPDIGMVLAHEVGHINGAVPRGARRGSQAHSIFDTVQTERTAWDTRFWSLFHTPQSIMDGADLDYNALFEGPVVNRNGVTDGGDWGHLFGVFANPHPAGEHYTEAPLPRDKRPAGSTSNLTLIGHVDGTSVSFSYVQVGRPDTPVTPSHRSPYELVQYGPSGSELGRWPVHLSSSSLPQADDSIQEDRSSFRVTLPFFRQTQRIALQLNGRELGAITVPTEAPTLRIKSSDAGPNSITARWRGRHPERRDLTYRVSYSVDGGANYRVLALLDGATTEYRIPYAVLPGSYNARLKLTASDGFNSVAVTSPAFTVPNKAPSVHILSPRDGLLVNQAVPVRAQALVTDREDGLLSGTAVEWFLDKHIPVCFGTECVIDEIHVMTGVGELSRVLSLGPHSLTARATDSGGRASEASVAFSVGRDSDGDGVSDDAEDNSGTNPRDLLDTPGMVRYETYFEWSTKLKEFVRQVRLVNPVPDPLETFVWVGHADGGIPAFGEFEIGGCSNTQTGDIPVDGRIRLVLPPREECSVRFNVRNIDESKQTMRIKTRVGVGASVRGSVRLTAVDERNGDRSCWFLPRLFRWCGPRTHELTAPANRMAVDPGLKPPEFERLLDLGPLMRAATPGALPQNPEQRMQLRVQQAQRDLDSDNVLRRVEALAHIAVIGPAADHLLPQLARSTTAERPVERAAAATAIGHMGSAAQRFVPRLRQLLRDPDESVARAARASLHRLRGETE